MAEIRVLDGAPVVGQKRDYGFSRTNTGQSYKKQNFETRDNSYSRVDKTGGAGSQQLQGFDQILQGYQGADDQDMEEWDALVTIGHPCVLNGIQEMQGKKERKEKKELRKQTKEAKKAEGKVFSPTAGKVVRAKKAQRQGKKKQRQTIRTAKKDTKLAKKQENVLKKQANRLRKDKNAEARRLRKADKDGGKTAKEIFADLTEKGKDIATAIISRPDQFDQSALDMNIPQDAGDLFDRWRGMDSEDVLDERAQIMADDDFDEGLYEGSAADAGAGADADAGDDKKGGNMLLYGGIAVAAALALSGGKKGKKKK